jgi:hypothetical protein
MTSCYPYLWQHPLVSGAGTGYHCTSHNCMEFKMCQPAVTNLQSSLSVRLAGTPSTLLPLLPAPLAAAALLPPLPAAAAEVSRRQKGLPGVNSSARARACNGSGKLSRARAFCAARSSWKAQHRSDALTSTSTRTWLAQAQHSVTALFPHA